MQPTDISAAEGAHRLLACKEPARKRPRLDVPFTRLSIGNPDLKERMLSGVARVLEHGEYILGPEVSEFERRFAEIGGTQYAVGVDNGTNALLLSMRVLGIGPGDEVITAVNSFLASASSIALAGARPVLVDVTDDFTIDPEQISRAMTPRTKAIIPVHLTGRPAAMDEITSLAAKKNLVIIEDAAQAVGARLKGKRVGGFGTMGCFSLHPLKVLGAAGDGGVITTSSAELDAALRRSRNHGLRNRDECSAWSYNARLDTVHAAMLLAKLDYLHEWIRRRREIASFYSRRLSRWVTIPVEQDGVEGVYQTYVIRAARRDRLKEFLAQRGIATKIHYPIPIHLQEAARELGYRRGDFPVAERHAEEILSLPMFPDLTAEQLEYVAQTIGEFYGA